MSAAKVKINYDRLASEYAQHRQVHPEVLRELLLSGLVKSTSRVLEVGCGTGNYFVTLEALTGAACWAIDPSIQMLAKAQARSMKASLQPGRAEKLDFPASFFDLVFSVDVIHHVNDCAQYFQEAYRVLKSGGQLCTVTDSEEIIRHRRPLANYFPETVEIELGRYPRISELREAMANAGFVSIAEKCVELVYTTTDIEMYRAKAFSCLHLISEAAFRRGIEQMEQDLQKGPLPCVSRYLLLWGTK